MIDGPAYSAAADPVITKMPAPMMAPIPSVTRFTGPRARFRLCSPVCPASCISVVIDFVANNGLPMQTVSRRGYPTTQANLDSSCDIVGCPHLLPYHKI